MYNKVQKATSTINYNNTYFYKLCCEDPDVLDIYVGHTTDFANRKSIHKRYCNNEKDRHYNIYVYTFIRNYGGWENWDMILIEKIKCDCLLDTLKKEREYIELLNATLNKNIQSRTKKEYNKDNEEQLKEQNKQYQTSPDIVG